MFRNVSFLTRLSLESAKLQFEYRFYMVGVILFFFKSSLSLWLCATPRNQLGTLQVRYHLQIDKKHTYNVAENPKSNHYFLVEFYGEGALRGQSETTNLFYWPDSTVKHCLFPFPPSQEAKCTKQRPRRWDMQLSKSERGNTNTSFSNEILIFRQILLFE